MMTAAAVSSFRLRANFGEGRHKYQRMALPATRVERDKGNGCA